jgi:hypothetical protein
MLIILSVFFENSGIMKAVPKDTQFEITDGKVVRFSDVQGVDEAKDVSLHHLDSANTQAYSPNPGTARYRSVSEGSCFVWSTGRSVAQRRSIDGVSILLWLGIF